jgi:quinol monooxygenase YgiN
MADKLLIVAAKMTAKSGKADALRATLMGLIEPTRAEAGCIQYDLHEEEGNPGSFLFFEKWTSKQALDEHLATPYLKGLFTVAPDLIEGEPLIGLYDQIG